MSIQMKRRWLFLFAFLLVPFSRMQASEVFSFVEGQDSKYIGKFVSIFTDPTGKLGLKDVSGQRTLFKSCKEDVPNLGLSQANRYFWLDQYMRYRTILARYTVAVLHLLVGIETRKPIAGLPIKSHIQLNDRRGADHLFAGIEL